MRFVGVKITNLDTDEEVIRKSIESCVDNHEKSIFQTVESTLDCISMGCCVAEPIFK